MRDTGLSLFRFTVKAQAMTTVFLLDNIPLPVRTTGKISRRLRGIRYFLVSDGVLPFVTAVFIRPEKHSGTG